MTAHDILHDVQVMAESAWKLLIKSIAPIMAGAFASVIKVKLSDKKMNFTQAFALFFLSFGCGSMAALITNNVYIAILAALVGDRVIQWIIMKFNKANIDDTMNKIKDKIKPL